MALIRAFLIVFGMAGGFTDRILQKNFKPRRTYRFGAIDMRDCRRHCAFAAKNAATTIGRDVQESLVPSMFLQFGKAMRAACLARERSRCRRSKNRSCDAGATLLMRAAIYVSLSGVAVFCVVL
ncbi:MAG: hypothetical protein K8H87_06840 [Pseudorhodoplanes sp.]|nr:hypothetical protein [Pseudorhodoplanes sp.]